MLNCRAIAVITLIAWNLFWPAQSSAIPFVTMTVFGDAPAVEHVPKLILDFVKDGPRTVLPEPVNAAGRKSANPPPPAGAGALAGASGVTLPGLQTRRPSGSSSQPFGDPSRMGSLDDTRLIDEADEALAQRQFASGPEKPEPAEGSVVAEAADKQVAEAVRAAALASQEAESDASMQTELKAELDDDLTLIDFGAVKIGEIDELANEDGVLGLVSVIDATEADDVMIDEDGHMVTTSDHGESSDLIQWQSKALQGIPTGDVPAGDVSALVSGAYGDASQSLMRQLTSVTSGAAAEKLSQGISTQQAAYLQTGRYAADLNSSLNQRPGSGQRAQERQFSMELLLVFLKAIFSSGQTYVGVLVLAVVGLILARVSRSSRAR